MRLPCTLGRTALTRSVVLFGGGRQAGEPLPSIIPLLNVPKATIWMVCHDGGIAVEVSLCPTVTVALFFQTSAHTCSARASARSEQDSGYVCMMF